VIAGDFTDIGGHRRFHSPGLPGRNLSVRPSASLRSGKSRHDPEANSCPPLSTLSTKSVTSKIGKFEDYRSLAGIRVIAFICRCGVRRDRPAVGLDEMRI
jgi:hypothetical protein